MLSVTFEQVSKRFDQVIAVNDLTLEIRAGELFFLLGPSGCGKTTCLRMVAGFYQPDGGQLRFGDRIMNMVPPHKRNTGMVFQNYALWPHMTVRGNVEYGLKIRKLERADREKRVQEALEMVRLGQLGDRYPNQLSGGQQQRVALARALVIRPDVLLLDEPLSNLDAQLRLEMRREIKRLHEETNTTALYVTHDQEEALSIADRIAVMKDGLLQQVGAPRELYRQPASRFVAEFMGETNLISGTLKRLDGEFAEIETSYGPLRAKRNGTEAVENQPIWCSIRPESWQLVTDDKVPVNENRLAARVDSVMYQGAVEQYQATLTGGRAEAEETAAAKDERHIKIAAVNPGARVAQPGDTLTLGCAPEDVVLLNA